MGAGWNRGLRPKRGFKWYFLRGKIAVDAGCWIWLGAQDKDGYGRIWQWRGGRANMLTAHQHFYELYRGSLVPGFDVAHSCHRRLCVQPRHLELQRHLDNLADGRADYPFSSGDVERVKELLQQGFTFSYIADQLRSPRLAIHTLARRINWKQHDFFDDGSTGASPGLPHPAGTDSSEGQGEEEPWRY